jgi:hypothetical protein
MHGPGDAKKKKKKKKKKIAGSTSSRLPSPPTLFPRRSEENEMERNEILIDFFTFKKLKKICLILPKIGPAGGDYPRIGYQ